MAVKTAAIILGVIALVLTFRADWILSNILKIPEPNQKQILTVKFIDFFVAVIAFLMVFSSQAELMQILK